MRIDVGAYPALAMRTLKPRDFFGDLEHAALGIVSEVGEINDQVKRHIIYGKPLDKVNIAEEIGDVLWYVALLCTRADIPFIFINYDLVEKPLARCALRMAEYAGMIACEVEVTRSRGSFVKPLYATHDLLHELKSMAHLVGYSIEEVMYLNIAKLEKRYPKQFTEHAALNRDLAAEREVLERR